MPKITNGFQLSTIFTKSSILDVWGGSEYATDISPNINHFLTRFNALQTGVAYLYPLKTSESLKVFLFLSLSEQSCRSAACSYIKKKRHQHNCFPRNEICNIFDNFFFAEHLWVTASNDISGKTKVSSS